METSAIASKIEDYVREQFAVDPTDSDFNADVHLFDYGYVDSFGAVNLTAYVEKTFDVKIADSDLIIHPMNTINEIAEFVSKRQKGEC